MAQVPGTEDRDEGRLTIMGRWDATQAEESRGFPSGGSTEFYSVRAEGSVETLTATPGITPADWDGAVEAAQVRARVVDRNHVVRVHAVEGARIVATVTPDGSLCWPRLATPTMRDEAGAA